MIKQFLNNWLRRLKAKSSVPYLHAVNLGKVDLIHGQAYKLKLWHHDYLIDEDFVRAGVMDIADLFDIYRLHDTTWTVRFAAQYTLLGRNDIRLEIWDGDKLLSTHEVTYG